MRMGSWVDRRDRRKRGATLFSTRSYAGNRAVGERRTISQTPSTAWRHRICTGGWVDTRRMRRRHGSDGECNFAGERKISTRVDPERPRKWEIGIVWNLDRG